MSKKNKIQRRELELPEVISNTEKLEHRVVCPICGHCEWRVYAEICFDDAHLYCTNCGRRL